MGLAAILVFDDYLDQLDGLILIFAFLLTLVWLVVVSKKRMNAVTPLLDAEKSKVLSCSLIVVYFVLGLGILLGGSHLLVLGASEIATYYQVSDFVIGLSIVAVGSSLPELAASIVAAKKGEHDIALGNVIGSNLFNMLVVLAMPAFISPGSMPPSLLMRDMPVMFIFSAVLFFMAYGFGGKKNSISRVEGVILLSAFLVYNYSLYALYD